MTGFSARVPLTAALVASAVGLPAGGQDVPPAASPEAVVQAKEAIRVGVELVKELVERARGPRDDDPELIAHRNQFGQQFRALLEVELSLVRVVCSPTPDQLARLARDGKAAAKAATDRYARGLWQQGRGGLYDLPQPIELVREQLAPVLETHLDADQMRRYRDELAERAADRKRVALENLLVRLDHDLALGDDQRTGLRNELAAHWDESWCPTIEYAARFGQDSLPNIPDPRVVPLLTAAQRAVWATLPRRHGHVFGFSDIVGLAVEVEEMVEEVEVEVDAIEVHAPEPTPAGANP